MQKIINVLAVASFAVSSSIAAGGVYVYINRDSIIDGVKQKVMGSFGGSALGGDLPIGAPDLAAPSTQASTPVPSGGLGISQF